MTSCWPSGIGGGIYCLAATSVAELDNFYGEPKVFILKNRDAKNQCCGSKMIYSGSGSSLNFPSSGSRQKFRIHVDPDPTYIN